MSTEKSATRSPGDTIILVILAAIALLGIGVIIGWHLHVRALVQVIPGAIPMQYNTALCFLVLGASGWWLVARRASPLLPALGGALVAVMGILVIFEYMTGVSVGVNTALFYPWERTLSADPGRIGFDDRNQLCVLGKHARPRRTTIIRPGFCCFISRFPGTWRRRMGININEVEILLVEDNPHDAELTLRALKKRNLANKIFHVKDGAEALDFIFATGAYAERNLSRTV